jgi:ribosomal protein L7/L12
VRGPADSVTAIKALREAAPGLSLKSAVDLAKTAQATEPTRRGA